MEHHDIIIIGAGLTGITAARRLESEGKRVLLVDKSKSVGGRLATRRVAKGKADHGAQFFTVRSDELQKEAADWLNKGWIKHWFGEDYPRYTSVNGMNGLAKKLAQGLNVRLESRVSHIASDGAKYTVVTEDKEEWECERVLITIPVPQTVELLERSSFSLDDLQSIDFQPTYVGIFQFRNFTMLPSSGHVDKQLPEGVERIVDHYKKGISDDVIVSVYMTAAWSSEHYGEEEVLDKIKEQAGGFFQMEDLVSEQLKKWRYAQAAQTFPHSYHHVSERLLTAGDAFLRQDDASGRTRFESAYLSGLDAAGAFLGS
ncbi:NAD(P)/FAD-dependent oxidoreductase [Halobacillus campisalis]|uniref:NAD(P)/FAD-dependent oxidoreductase n=1 Tax=Halobacillus campisalis TaxID=435909 RepID=A0ABW2JYM4_9BACI|nr:FAD-dependent oxidoreductase [Halobacillus campisalis]